MKSHLNEGGLNLQTLLILIVIGILSAVFGKGKLGRGQTRNKSFLPDNLKEIRTLFNQQMENYSTKKPSPVLVNQDESDSLEKHQSVYKDSEGSLLQINNQQNTEKKQTKIVAAPVQDNRQVDEQVSLDNVDAKTLINGIVWAEILGEPRSKKPHFARKG